MFRYILDNLKGEYLASDGRTVAVNRRGAKEMTTYAPLVKLRVAPELANLIGIGLFRELVDTEHKQFKQFAYYDVVFKIGDKWYEGILNIGVRESGESCLYDVNPFEEKTGPPVKVSRVQAESLTK